MLSTLDLFVLLATGALIILLFYAIRGILLAAKQQSSSPGLQTVIDALQPWIMKAILAGTYLAEKSLSDLGKELSGVDRKAIADRYYDLLPPALLIHGVPIPIGVVKLFVSRQMFETLIEDTYRAAQAEITTFEVVLKAEVEKLKSQPAKASLSAISTSDGRG